MSDYFDLLDRLVEDGVLTPIGTPRCQVNGSGYGRYQCPNEGDKVAMTTLVAVPHMTIRVCSAHADDLPPGWGVRL